MGASAIPLVISALSAGAEMYNNRQVAKEQDTAAIQGIQAQAANQRKADETVNASVDQLGQSTPEAARAQATNDFLGQLRRNRAQSVTGGALGSTSSRFNTDAAGAQKDIANFGEQNADLMGRINAPSLQREQEGVGMNRLSTDLGSIARNSAGDQFLTQLRMRSARPNPWVTAGAGLGTGAANGMATRAPKNKGPGTPSTYRDNPSVPAGPYAPRNA
jgi:hypothetical protein